MPLVGDQAFQRKSLDPQHLHRLAEAAGHTHQIRLQNLQLEESESARAKLATANAELEERLADALNKLNKGGVPTEPSPEHHVNWKAAAENDSLRLRLREMEHELVKSTKK